jgi:crotonobetainyl-CoA:carnitine CoA-transferase CaiB-like acyl-CoA transferase
MNILLGLRQRDLTGQGCHLDVSMADNLFPLMYWGLGHGWAANLWPKAGDELLTGGSPRYQIYQTSDHRYLSAAPLEDKFWRRFLELIGAPELTHLEQPALVKASIARIIAAQPAAHWMALFEGQDVCVAEIVSLEQATQDKHFQERGVFKRQLKTSHGEVLSALPTPLSPHFLSPDTMATSPQLGQHTDDIL